MKTIRTARAMQVVARRLRARGNTIGFVPTMGALHEGHRALIRAARRTTDAVVVSLFVNPRQFGPAEHFRRYPRDLAGDARLCRQEHVDWLFVPSEAELYPKGFQTVVEVQQLSRPLCGESRPGHFRGVATVVLTLFGLVRPDRAFFGQKDYQQLVVIRRMVRDLHLPVEVVSCPTIREPDGLACSSRNRFLSPAERRHAPSLYAALQAGARLVRSGESRAQRIIAAMRRRLTTDGPRVGVDYLAVVEPETLKAVRRVAGSVVLLGAIRAGTTRLIDNLIVCGPSVAVVRDGPRGLTGMTSRSGGR